MRTQKGGVEILREGNEGRSERESQDSSLAFDMGHFLDSHSFDFWCPVFLKGGVNENQNFYCGISLFIFH